MSLFKLLFKFNPSKLKVIPAEQMSPAQQSEISDFLGDVANRLLKGDFDVTASQLKYLKDQGDEVARLEQMIAERGSKGIGSLKKSADVIEFPVKPKPPEGEPFKSGGAVGSPPVSKTQKIVNFLGGKDVVAAELGLLGVEQLYNLLGMPLGFEKGGIVGDKSGPPPEKGPNSQGLETLFQNR